MRKSLEFRKLIKRDEIIVAPGVPTPLFARLVEEAGFKAVNVTGAGVANMNFCLPDYGMITMKENWEIIKRINDATTLPLVVDLDDGYGGGINVYRTISEVSRLDVGSVFIEDQKNPKRCGHFENHALITTSEMCGKIKAARDASWDPDLFIFARTDAISSYGTLDAAIERAEAYIEAGADGIFIEAPQSVEDMRKIPKLLSVPTIINMVEMGKTPMFKNKELQDMGYKLVFYGNAVLKGSMFGVQNVLNYLKENDTTMGGDNKVMITSAERHRITEKDRYMNMVKKYQG